MCDTTHPAPQRGLSARISFPENVLFRDLGSEAVLLELGTGKYYGLAETALRMVVLLREHGRLEPVYRALLEEYDVPEDELRLDLLSFVDLLESRELVQLDDE